MSNLPQDGFVRYYNHYLFALDVSYFKSIGKVKVLNDFFQHASFVTESEKTRLPHTSSFITLRDHNSM